MPELTFQYLDLDGELVAGTVWAPGPLVRSIWVLPVGCHRSHQAVVVKHPDARGGPATGAWWQVENNPHDRVTTGMSAKDWRDAVAADPTIGEQLELVDDVA